MDFPDEKELKIIKDLAKKLEVPRSRVSEIVKCRIYLFTIDRLIEHHSKLFPDQEIELSQKVS